MNLKVQAARNILSNWSGLLVNMVVGFFLAPFILHRLGDVAFGLYVLVFSLTGYYGLFDFGIRSSVLRYVAKFAAGGEKERLAQLISTSLFSYCAIAVLALLATGVISFFVDYIFKIPPGFLSTARIVFLIVGTGIALGFPLSVFAGILQGLQNFHWINVSQIVSSLLRALLIVVALEHRGGLISVALIVVSLNLLCSVSYGFIAFRLLPLPVSLRLVDRSTFRMIISYGAVTFVIGVAEGLRFQSDAAVIGIFLSSAAITYFSVGSKLVDYITQVVQSMAQIFVPMSSHFDAVGEPERLGKILILGNRACALLAFPMCAGLILLGKPIIEAWVGAQYLSSYSILLLLIVPKTLYLAQATSTKILFGMGRHRPLAVVLLLEGSANLILSIALIRPYGINGVAVGTAIPLACTSLIFLPLHLCRLLNLPLTSFLKQAYLTPLALCTPMVAVLIFLRYVFVPHSLVQLLIQVALAGLVYGIGLLWFFVTKEPAGVAWRMRFQDYLHHVITR